MGQDRLEDAQAFLNEVIATNPNEPRWQHQLGQMMVARDRPGAAISSLQRAAELTLKSANPSQAILADWLTALFAANRAAEAIAAYEALDASLVTPGLKSVAAQAYQQAGREDDARRMLNEALDEASLDSLNAVKFVGVRLVNMLGARGAFEMLDAATQRAADKLPRLRLQALAATRLTFNTAPENRARGIQLADEIVKQIDETHPIAIEAMTAKATALGMEERYDEVVKIYERLHELVPTNMAILNNLAYLLGDQLNRPAEALPYAEALHTLVRESATRDANLMDTIGWLYSRNDRLQEAETALREACIIEPRNLFAIDHLAETFLKSGQRAEARRSYQRLADEARKQRNDLMVQKASEALRELDGN